MSTPKKEIASIVNKYMNSELYLQHYNKLNSINNNNEYPWDMHKKIDDEYFVPTYKNVSLYYANMQTKKKDGSRKSHGGNSNKTTVYLL